MFVWQGTIVELRTPWLHTYRLVLQYAICLPKWMIIQHFNTQQTSIAAKAQEEEEEEEEEKRKKSETKLSGASCFAICHCHGCARDMLKQLSWEVVEIILDCFHLQAPDSPLGVPAQSELRAGFGPGCRWLTNPCISCDCRTIKLLSLSSLRKEVLRFKVWVLHVLPLVRKWGNESSKHLQNHISFTVEFST